jgi:rare lipoprotein A
MKENAMAVPRYLPAVIALTVLMTGCGTSTSTGEHRSLIPLPWKHRPAAGHAAVDPDLPVLPPAGSGRGGYYQDDGPGPNPPANLRQVPDAEVRYEPYARFANKPYSVFGQTYTPLLNEEPFNQRGIASWYGVKFHGQRTSSGEAYDMYKMTAAHPTLPIPSYARVTSVVTGKSVVVRINDRGPFHSDRVIDVSYTAALKLGLLGKGSHEVEIERLFANDPTRVATARREATSQAQALSAATGIGALPGDQDQADGAAAARPASKEGMSKTGFYLQLGAFNKAGKAEEMSQRLAKSGVDTSVLDVVQSGSVKRIYSGPFETRALALAAARALPSSLGLKPVVVKR